MVCQTIGCLVSLEKTEWANTKMIFLGILLNGSNFTLAVPQDKRRKAINLLNWVIGKKKITIHTIQRLTGILNFLQKAIVPGRTFTRRMCEKLKWRDNSGRLLKQYHHVKLDREFIDDCKVWLDFLQNEMSGKLCRPMIDFSNVTIAKTLNFYSDSSANVRLGMGVIYENRWICTTWGNEFMTANRPCIQFLELYALVAAVITWAELLPNCRIQIFCDNTSVRDAVNKASSKCDKCMILLRLLVHNNLKFNQRIFVLHVKSCDNILADAISQLDFDRFWHHAPENMNTVPDTIPAEIWPPEKI